MKAKTDKLPKEEYQLTEKEFTKFAKALVSVPKTELSSQKRKSAKPSKPIPPHN